MVLLVLLLLSLLVVEPTHLKNMLVKMGSSSPSFGVNIKKCLKSPPTVVVVVVDDGFIFNVEEEIPRLHFRKMIHILHQTSVMKDLLLI